MYQELAEKLQPTCIDGNCRRIGMEVERIGFKNNAPVPYPVMAQFLTEICDQNGWEKVENESGQILGGHTPFGKLSLEPGSQFEISSLPMGSTDEVESKYKEFNALVDPIRKKMGFEWLPLGLNPVSRIEDIKIIPSKRYDIMTEYLSKRGKLSLWMMRLTASIQLNFDYQNEKEAIEMLRVALMLAPVSYGLFGNSRNYQNKVSGYKSYRAEIWRQMDPDRSGLFPEVFEKGFGFEEYAKDAASRPLMFAQKDSGDYVATDGKSLLDIHRGKLPGVPADENNQLNCLRELFFEARLKQGYIEVRSIDYVPEPMLYKALTFWTKTIYSPDARAFVLDYYRKQTHEERMQLWIELSKSGNINKDFLNQLEKLGVI